MEGRADLTKSDIAVASVQGAFVVAFNVGSNAAPWTRNVDYLVLLVETY